MEQAVAMAAQEKATRIIQLHDPSVAITSEIGPPAAKSARYTLDAHRLGNLGAITVRAVREMQMIG